MHIAKSYSRRRIDKKKMGSRVSVQGYIQRNFLVERV